MVRNRFVIGAALTVCHDVIYLGLRFSILGIKLDNGEIQSASGSIE